MTPALGIDENRLVETFFELTSVNGPSGAEREVADLLKAFFLSRGLTPEEDDVHLRTGGNCGNLLCRVPGKEGAPLLLCAHLDTIAPTAGVETIEEDGVFRARGGGIIGVDDRAGIAVILEVVRCLLDSGGSPVPLELLFPVSEETGLMGAAGLAPGWLRARAGFTLDLSGPIGSLVAQAPYGQDLEFTVRGRAAHAGICPEAGVSAIAIAAAAISRLRQGRLDEISTANIGVIRGGEATNIVTPLVYVRGEARSLEEKRLLAQVEHMEETFRAAAAEMGGAVEIASRRAYTGYKLPGDSYPVRLVRAAAEKLGFPFQVQVSCGASDANPLNALGIATANLSVAMGDPHAPTEYIRRVDLIDAARLVLETVRRAVDPCFPRRS